jgi:hypothetical protein
MQTLLDACSLPAAQRVDYWRWVMQEVLHAECEVTPEGQQPFEATMGVMPFGSWNLVQVTGTAQTTHRQGAGAEGWVSIMVQLKGMGRMAEQGREACCAPATCASCGQTRDHRPAPEPLPPGAAQCARSRAR